LNIYNVLFTDKSAWGHVYRHKIVAIVKDILASLISFNP